MGRQVWVSIIWIDKCVNIYTIGRQVWVFKLWVDKCVNIYDKGRQACKYLYYG